MDHDRGLVNDTVMGHDEAVFSSRVPIDFENILVCNGCILCEDRFRKRRLKRTDILWLP